MRIGLVVLLCNLIDESVGRNNDKLSSRLCVEPTRSYGTGLVPTMDIRSYGIGLVPTMDIRSYGIGLVQVDRTEHAIY